ncbi:MAG: MBL fold metallo-hydrolase [Tabrizicola sp.]|nr:MBL fold metallo-hydrolase [Tabrizicola sp.]
MRLIRRGQGYAEVQLGDLSVIALSDGEAEMTADCARAPGGGPLAEAEMTTTLVDGKIQLQVFAFLIRGPEGTMLIDAGAGDAWRATTGRLIETMVAAGVSPDEVDQIALTHTHVDHIGGLARADGSRVFRNARRVLVPTEELGMFRAEPHMAPVLSLVLPLEQGDGVMKGVVAINAPGHEAGHMAFLIDGRLLIWGDLVHLPHLQFSRPEITWKFDADPVLATATRRALFDRAIAEGLTVAGAHLPYPAIGRVSDTGQGYAFHPMGSD